MDRQNTQVPVSTSGIDDDIQSVLTIDQSLKTLKKYYGDTLHVACYALGEEEAINLGQMLIDPSVRTLMLGHNNHVALLFKPGKGADLMHHRNRLHRVLVDIQMRRLLGENLVKKAKPNTTSPSYWGSEYCYVGDSKDNRMFRVYWRNIFGGDALKFQNARIMDPKRTSLMSDIRAFDYSKLKQRYTASRNPDKNVYYYSRWSYTGEDNPDVNLYWYANWLFWRVEDSKDNRMFRQYWRKFFGGDKLLT